MSPTNEADGVAVHPLTVVEGPLRDVRTVHVRDAGLVVTHELTPRRDGAVRFLVIDPLPGRLDLDLAGFHPDHRPAAGQVDGRFAVLSDVVDADATRRLRYGLCPAEPLTPEAVAELQDAAPPSIEVAEAVEPGTVSTDELEAAAMARSPGTDAEGSTTDRLRSLLGLGR